MKNKKLCEKYRGFNEDELIDEFFDACEDGNLSIVQYLLINTDLKYQVDIHQSNDLAIILCCEHGHLEVVKYLLTSSSLKKHADIHANNDSPFCKAYLQRHLDIVRFLIFDMNIKRSEFMDDAIDSWPFQLEDKRAVERMFELRELNKELEIDLKSGSQNHQRMKV